MLTRLQEILVETCQQMDCELLEFNGEGDHVHLLLNLHPKHAAANVVGKLKGKSAYHLRREFKQELRPKLWGAHLWSPSYCLVSTGGAAIETIRKYIESQQEPA